MKSRRNDVVVVADDEAGHSFIFFVDVNCELQDSPTRSLSYLDVDRQEQLVPALGPLDVGQENHGVGVLLRKTNGFAVNEKKE